MTLYLVVTEALDSGSPANPFVNAFTYDVSDVLPSSVVAQQLANNFRDQVLSGTDGWEDIVRATTTIQRVIVTSPFNPSVLGINTTPLSGNRPTPSMPRFVAWGFKSERTRADIRAGFKRFGVLSEGDTVGDAPSGSMLLILDAFADKMSAVLEVSDGIDDYTATPVIVKRIAYETPEGNTAYRLPESPTEYQYMTCNWAFQSITTQNSRKA